MNKFELGNGTSPWTDITSFTEGVTVQRGRQAEGETWGDRLKGLESSSMTLTFDNSDGPVAYTASAWPVYPMPEPKVRVSVEVPDGRWQTFKWQAKHRFPRLLRRLKVRYITHTFDAVLDQWDGGPDVSGRVEGTIAKSVEEHR